MSNNEGNSVTFVTDASGPTDLTKPYMTSSWDLRKLYVYNKRKEYLDTLSQGDLIDERTEVAFMQAWIDEAAALYAEDGYYVYDPVNKTSVIVEDNGGTDEITQL